MIGPLRSLWGWLWGEEPRCEFLVSVHATVISLFGGVLAAYSVHVYGVVDEFERQAFFAAERAAHLDLGWHTLSPASATSSSYDDRVRLIRRFTSLVYGVTEGPRLSSTERGDELIDILNVIGNQYPFPSFEVEAPFPNSAALKSLDRVPPSFASRSDLQAWTREVTHIAGALVPHLDRVADAFLAGHLSTSEIQYAEGRKEVLQPFQAQFFSAEAERLETAWKIRRFRDMAVEAQGMAGAVDQSLRRLAGYTTRTATLRELRKGAAAAMFAFASGVLVPIVWGRAPRLLVLLIPVGTYFVGLALGVSRLW